MALAAPAADKRGLKRICLSCSTRFYDFNKRPIVCPHCSTEYTGDMKIKIRRARPLPEDTDAPIVDIDDTPIESIKDHEDVEEEESETVSLDELDEDSDEEEEEVDADLDMDAEDDLDDEDDDDDDEDDDDEDEDE